MSRRRLLIRALLLLGSTSVSFGICEWIWRQVAEAEYRRRLEQFSSGLFESTPNEPWLYGLHRNVDFVERVRQPDGMLEVRYRTNADGLRHHEAWPPRMDDQAVRILFLGDSYTFGLNVQDHEPYPFAVEAALRRSGIDAVAINAGVSGYNTEQECARLPSLLERYRPRFCVIGFVLNDAAPIVIVPLPPREVYRYCGSWLFEDSKPLLNQLALLVVDDSPLFTSRKLWDDPDDLSSYLPGNPRWPDTRAALVSMHRLCRARGVRLLVAILPDFTRSFDDTYPLTVIHEHVMAVGAAEGFPVLDVLQYLRGHDSRRLHIPLDGHPNAEGHRLLGEIIAQRGVELLRD